MKTTPKHAGFTLMEVILVIVLIAIVATVSVPYFASSLRGTKLKNSARTIEKVARYGRSLAILREQTMTMAIDDETMELFLGGPALASTNAADGELDQEVLKRLGYVEGDDPTAQLGIEKEVQRRLPSDLEIVDFEKDQNEEDEDYQHLYLVRFYPNGQAEWFEMEIQDSRGHGVHIENDPISGKVWSELLQ